MLDFLRRNRILVTAGLGLLLAAGLALGTSRDRGRADSLSRFFLEVMAPLQRVSTGLSRSVRGVGDEIVGLWNARTENVRLRAQVGAMQRRLGGLGEVALENARLRRLLRFRKSLPADLVAARVIGYDASGLGRTLTIDRGARDGIVKGAAVLAPEGAVGQVFLVSRRVSRVLLIVDHNGGVDAIVQRSRVRGIVQGTADGGCALEYVNRTENLQPGDLVVASGMDGIFPKGLPVGEITAVDRKGGGLFLHASVAPHVDFDHLEEVLVTLGPPGGAAKVGP